MARVVEVVYEDGVLKPLEKLDLKEDQHVRIRIIERYYSNCLRDKISFKKEVKG